MRTTSWVLAVVLAVAGCATAQLSPEANKVIPVQTPPGPECQNLGAVIGAGGGTFGGGWISNDQLSTYVMNDALNKAAAKGATHLQITPPQLGGGSGTTTTATETGIAFKCPAATSANDSGTPASAWWAGPSAR